MGVYRQHFHCVELVSAKSEISSSATRQGPNMNLTIEECLETAIHAVQNNSHDEHRFKDAQDKLFYLCCGIVAGLKANKQGDIRNGTHSIQS